MADPKTLLGAPLHLSFSGRTVQNRFAKAATTERLSSWDPDARSDCGIPSPEVIRLFERYARGGAGLINTGAMTVDPAYLEAPGNAIIGPKALAKEDDPRFQAFKRFALAVKSGGGLAIGQLNHTGRQTTASMHPSPVSASDVKLEQNELGQQYNKPHPATHDEITDIVDAFVHGAAYLEAAGWDGVQLNAAHGYLFSQFMSLRTNKRTDNYGGGIANRARLLLDVVRAVRARCAPHFVVSVKLNCIEYQPDAITLEDVKTVCGWLEEAQVDIIELSAGTYEEFAWKHREPHTSRAREGYFLNVADALRPALTKTRLYATGGFYTVPAMMSALEVVDGIGLARALCHEPDLPRLVLNGQSTGRAAQVLDQDSYSITAMLAFAQMQQMSKGEEPMDGGNKAVVDGFVESLRAQGILGS